MTRFRISLEYVIATCTVVCLASHAAVGADASVGLVAEDNNTWELWAWTSSGDNDGIMAYDVEVDGTNLTGVHESPLETAVGYPVRGFVIGGEPIPNDDTGNRLFASMTDNVPSTVFYGVGSPDVGTRIPVHVPQQVFELRQWDWHRNEGFRTSGATPFEVPDKSVLLASGTGDWRTIGFGDVTEIEVWSFGEAAVNGLMHEPAIVTLYVDRPVPEPTAVAQLFVLSVGLWCVRKQS